MDRVTEVYLVDIIRQEMALPVQNVWIKSQNRKFPNTQDLFAVVGTVDSPAFSNVKTIREETDSGAVLEVQQVQFREVVNIDLISENDQARERRAELVLAINSYYAQQVQEANNFKIFKIPSFFVDSTDAEGGSQLNRFTLSIICHTWYRKEKVLSSDNGDYYNDFDNRVDDEETIGEPDGIIEFNITES